MTLKSEAKFKENLPCDFKYDMRNLIKFHQTTQKYEDFFLMGSFYPNYTRFAQQKTEELLSMKLSYIMFLNYIMFQLQNYREIMCHDNEG